MIIPALPITENFEIILCAVILVILMLAVVVITTELIHKQTKQVYTSMWQWQLAQGKWQVLSVHTAYAMNSMMQLTDSHAKWMYLCTYVMYVCTLVIQGITC